MAFGRVRRHFAVVAASARPVHHFEAFLNENVSFSAWKRLPALTLRDSTLCFGATRPKIETRSFGLSACLRPKKSPLAFLKHAVPGMSATAFFIPIPNGDPDTGS